MADEKLIFDLLTGQNQIGKTLSGVKTQVAGIESGISSFSPALASAAKSVSGVAGAFKGLGITAAAAFAGFVGSSIIRAAEEQESAISSLNVALKSAGNFSTAASKEIQDYASNLQALTGIADEVTASNIGLLQSIGSFTINGLQKANTAAVDLAATYKIDLETATRLIGKAANGNITAFGKLGIVIKKGSDDAQTFANTLKALEKNQGAAAAATQTFAGANRLLSANFGDILEELGNIVIQNPVVIQGVKDLSVAFASVASSLKEVVPTLSSMLSLVLSVGPTIAKLALEFVLVSRAVKFAAAAFQAYRIQLDVIQARQGVGIFSALITQIRLVTSGLGLATLATRTLSLSITAAKAAATFGLTLAFDAIITALIEMSGRMNVFKEAIALAGRFALFVVEQFDALVSNLAEFAKVAASVPGGPEFLDSVSEGLANLAKGSRARVDELRAAVVGLNKEAADAAASKLGGGTGDLLDSVKIAARVAESAKEAIKKQVEELQKGLKEAGDTQFSILAKEAGLRAGLIVKAERSGILTRKQGEELLSKVRLDAIQKAGKAQDALTQKQIEDSKAFLDVLKGTPRGPGQQGNASNVSGEEKAQITSAQLISSSLAGAAGAAGAVKAAMFSVIDALGGALSEIPVVGAIIGEIFDKLALAPAEFTKNIEGFFKEIPNVISNILINSFSGLSTIIKQIPSFLIESLRKLPEILVELFINSFVDLFIAVVDIIANLPDMIAQMIPELIQKFFDGILLAVQKLINSMPQVAQAFANAMPGAAITFGTEIGKQVVPIAISFVNALVKEAPRFIEELIKAIPASFGFGDIGGGGGGDIFKSIASLSTGGLSNVFGFADGGTALSGGPSRDRIPALLKPNEQVLGEENAAKLTQVLDSLISGGGRSAPTTVQIIVGEQQLASVMLDLNRRGFRTA